MAAKPCLLLNKHIAGLDAAECPLTCYVSEVSFAKGYAMPRRQR